MLAFFSTLWSYLDQSTQIWICLKQVSRVKKKIVMQLDCGAVLSTNICWMYYLPNSETHWNTGHGVYLKFHSSGQDSLCLCSKWCQTLFRKVINRMAYQQIKTVELLFEETPPPLSPPSPHRSRACLKMGYLEFSPSWRLKHCIAIICFCQTPRTVSVHEWLCLVHHHIHNMLLGEVEIFCWMSLSASGRVEFRGILSEPEFTWVVSPPFFPAPTAFTCQEFLPMRKCFGTFR